MKSAAKAGAPATKTGCREEGMLPAQRDERELELERVCEAADKRSDTYKILHWLGKQTISDPYFRTGSSTVFLKCLADAGSRRDWPSYSPQIRAKHESSTRSAISAARDHITAFYKKEGFRGNLRICLPLDFNGEPRRKGRHGLRFVRLRQRKAPSVVERRKLTPAESLWNALLGPVQSFRALLIYSVERPQISPERYDENGLFSGSGEVAACFSIAGCLGIRRDRVDVRRTCDVTLAELRSASCLILLGSSIHEDKFQQLRDEMSDDDRWPGQAYFFGETSVPGERYPTGLIRKVRGEDQGKEFIYHYKTLRDHETDYALVSYFRDRFNRRTLLALQGISTVATRAAAEFLCSTSGTKELQKQLSFGSDAGIPNFEVILEVTCRSYVPVKVEIRDHFLHTSS